MAETPSSSGAATLLYRATCAKCRRASAAVVVASCGRVRRVPLDSPEAQRLYADFGEPPGKLALLFRGRFRTGWRVPPSVARIVALSILVPCVRAVRPSSTRHAPTGGGGR